MIYRTRIVTFPRSGHTWLAQLLAAALGEEFVYSEYHSNGITLENNPEINAQKTHDFDLKTKISTEFKHVIQNRNFPDSVHSWYKIKPNAPFPFTDDYSDFVAQAKVFRAAWEKKWIESSVPNRMVIYYRHLIADPEKILAEVIRHITDMGSGSCLRAARRAVMAYPSRHR